jgi:hypothetical protein
MFLSWLAAQMLTADGTEGRGLHTILIPTALRRLLFREREVVQDGDVRGAERQLSAAEGSVRAYKVSKTYSGRNLIRFVLKCTVSNVCHALLLCRRASAARGVLHDEQGRSVRAAGPQRCRYDLHKNHPSPSSGLFRYFFLQASLR